MKEQLTEIIRKVYYKKNRNLFTFLTGAGISAESGIKTFRDADGLWEGHDVMEVASPEGWHKNKELVLDFYNQRRRQLHQVKPNLGHFTLAELEADFDIQIITQNVDDLHERAGSKQVIHLHGNIMQAKSSGPRQEEKYYPVSGSLDLKKDVCEEGYPLRPHVVWFGEEVPNYEKARAIIQKATVFIVIGTSLNVYPAAGLIHYTSPDCRCFLIDPNAAELNVPQHFTVLKTGAAEGMKNIMELFSEK